MGIIYYRWTATCLLEFQAADRSRDLPRSIFTFQLQLNRHDKRTQHSRGRTSFSYTASSQARRTGLNAKVPDMVAEGAEQGRGGERREGEKLNELETEVERESGGRERERRGEGGVLGWREQVD